MAVKKNKKEEKNNNNTKQNKNNNFISFKFYLIFTDYTVMASYITKGNPEELDVYFDQFGERNSCILLVITWILLYLLLFSSL